MKNDEERTLTIKGEGMARGQVVVIKELPLNKIKLGRNSRISQSEEDLSGLMQSINSVGLLEPIGVVETKDGKGYEVAYGHRRFLAFSKLGLHSIPAVIKKRTNDNAVDVMNLAENVQRRNISMAEIGRYASILEGEGLNLKELAVRLGCPLSYVTTAIQVYKTIPEEFRKDLEIRVPGQSRKAGTISLDAAKAIITVQKAHPLPKVAADALFKAARDDIRFKAESVTEYVAAIKKGRKDPIGDAKQIKTLQIRIMMDEREYNRLHSRFVEEGPFQSMTALMKAILKGEKNVPVKIIE